MPYSEALIRRGRTRLEGRQQTNANVNCRGKRRGKKKKNWTRERPVTRSVARRPGGDGVVSASQEESTVDVVNSVTEPDPKNYREAVRSLQKEAWLKAIVEELQALEQNGVWKVVRLPQGAHALYGKWVFKTKRDAEGAIERLKARLVACGNDQIFGVNYSVTFAAVIVMTSVKIILALARKWDVPAKHGDVPNAYVKEEDLDIYMRIPQGMEITDEMRKELGVRKDEELVLELRKALYGLKQAGRLWSRLLHSKLKQIGFEQSLTDMCVYYRRDGDEILIVGVYVDDLLVTGTAQTAVDAFFGELSELVVKGLGEAHKFLGMRITYGEVEGYDLDQEVTIEELLKDHGMEYANGVRVPIGEECNEREDGEQEMLPVVGADGVVTVRSVQSLVGSLLWIARCTRPDIAFAVHKASRRTRAYGL
ncbi:hypothetical protein PI124_g21839 [Phytophthora idaei]|nr:hypothetical protein PI124_g21839 [Phytophthora idaei]